MVQRRHINPAGVEDNDVCLLAWRERTDLRIEPKSFSAVEGSVAKHVARGQQWWQTGRRRRPLIRRIEVTLLKDHLINYHAFHVHSDAHLCEEVRRHRAFDVYG